MTDNFHQNTTIVYYKIADVNCGMYHPDTFPTEEEARKVIKTEYENSPYKYWRNRKQIVLKITNTQEVLG